jgi:hypothetical protein
MFNQIRSLAGQCRRFLAWPSFRVAIGLIVFCSIAASLHAQTNNLLLDLLVKKGIVTQDEAEKLKSEAESVGTNNLSTSSTKWKITDGIKSVELYGDIRMRYESRDIQTPGGGHLDLDRFRYALRIGLRGDLASDFYYGLRMETASNPRSPWVTFGTSSSGAPYQGPFGKSTSGIDVGRLYVGWHPISEIDITVGKMPNPLFTTPMVWDTDINPEGASEHFKYEIGPAEFFATFSQFIYQDDNPSSSTFGLFGGNDTRAHRQPALYDGVGRRREIPIKQGHLVQSRRDSLQLPRSWNQQHCDWPRPGHPRILRYVRRRRRRCSGGRSQRLSFRPRRRLLPTIKPASTTCSSWNSL